MKARGYSDHLLSPIFNKPLPFRTDILQQRRTDIHRKKNPGVNDINNKKHSPVAILHLPKINGRKHHQHIIQLFSLPDSILTHEYFQQAFPNHTRSFPIFARKLGKNINRLVTTDVSFRTPRDNTPTSTIITEENPNPKP